ncbi:FkbM family methyltransferase [Pseudaestuariivita sp.]|uniref:FkbM family methyltransferase n=1 Tax=Pseudaestuariivita sp. TaxID=2211669 RepID=UPI0040582F16
MTTLLNALAKQVGHSYPLKSGCGTLANTSLMRALDRRHGQDDWARVVGGPALVPSGDYVARAMKYVGDLDPKVSWVVDRVLRPGDLAIDIGANLGLVTLRMSERVGASGSVHAFEPQARLRSYVSRSLVETHRANVTLHGMALGPEPGKLLLTVPDDNAGAASLLPGDGASEEVPVETLDRMSTTFGPRSAAMMKIDVEGFETEVLKGGTRYLSERAPHVLLLEEHRPTAPALPESLQLLIDRGFTLYGLPKRLMRVALEPLARQAENTPHDYVALSARCPAEIKARLGAA